MAVGLATMGVLVGQWRNIKLLTISASIVGSWGTRGHNVGLETLAFGHLRSRYPTQFQNTNANWLHSKYDDRLGYWFRVDPRSLLDPS